MATKLHSLRRRRATVVAITLPSAALAFVDVNWALMFWYFGIVVYGYRELGRPGEPFRDYVVRSCFPDAFYDEMRGARLTRNNPTGGVGS